MTQDDKQFVSQFVIVLGGLVVFTVVIFVIARVLMSYNEVDYGPMIEKQVAERTAPVGESHSGKVPEATQTAASGGGSAGEQTYTQVCSSCHDSGASGAPMITDKGSWASRIKQGKQTLYDHAINGIGAMPAKGGDPSLSDEDVQAAVDYIVATVSGGGQTAKSSQAKSGRTKQASATTGAATAGIARAALRGASSESKATYQAMCSSCHDSGALGAPMVTDPAAWQARIAMGPQALYSSAINGVGAMPAKGGHAQLSEDEVKGAVDYIIAQVSGGKVSTTTSAATVGIVQAAAQGGSPENKATYQAMCSSCHDSGALGAPMVTDPAAWQAHRHGPAGAVQQRHQRRRRDAGQRRSLAAE
ncbi:MAG: c-type cytochrome [Gammaproteobacteria bacterium]|nr:c-type cytochrome [Gammaproteobacteria bacterium]